MSKRTIKIIGGILFGIFYAMVLTGHYLKAHRAYAPVTLSGEAPDFTWHGKDGTPHTLKELKGHVVIMHFWGAWCDPCRAEFPSLLKNAAMLGKNVTVFAVSTDLDPAKAQKFIQAQESAMATKTPDNMIYIFDPERKVTYDAYKVMAFPTSIFIDAKLQLRQMAPGAVAWENEQLRNYLAQLMQ